MKNLFNRQFETLLRVRAFFEKHVELFPPTSLSGKTFGIVAAAIPELSKFMRSHASVVALTQQGVVSKAEARQEVRDRLEAVTRTARSIGRKEPGVASLFRMPRDVGDQGLIGAARSFLENADAMKDVFVEHEMPATFVQELAAAIQRLETAISDNAGKKGMRSTATDAFEETMDKAMDAVYQLAGMVPNKLNKDGPILQEWEVARRVVRARTAKTPEAQAAPATSPPSTPPPAA
jgi:hypothetical protein